MKESRRHSRIPFLGPLRLGWCDLSGEPRYAIAKCLDVSESGLRVEVPVSIPQRTSVSLNAERIKLSGSATVRHVVRHGAKYIVGLELSQKLQEKTAAALREPWALRTEAGTE